MIVRALALSALSVLAAAPATAQEGIRVGFVTILTGPLAAPGKEMENGIELFLQQQKRTLAGRRVELTVVDSGGQPAGTLARARELVEQRRVHVVLGPLAAFEAYALAPYVNAQRIPTISPSAAADDLTQRKATQFFVRAASTSSQPTQPFGTYAAKTLGYTKIATIADDFAFGHEVMAGFHKAFGTDPGYYSVGAYTAGLFLKQALEKVSGKVEDTDAFLKALRGVTIADAPGGPIRLDKYGQPIHNIYIRRVERKDGRLQNTVIHTIENVSQFWTSPEDEFLKQPPYSRAWPPCKHC